MTRGNQRGMAALCLAVALLGGIAAGLGVFARGDGSSVDVVSVLGEKYSMVTTGVYRNNAQRVVAEGIGWDVLTLFVVVPAMLLALRSVARGSVRGRLFALGLLGYFFYQYFMYALTWAFGPLFLLFVAIYAASLAGIAWIASTLRLSEIPRELSPRFPAKGMAIYAIVMGVMLLLMWLARISQVLSGKVEGILLGQTTLVVQALDLGLIVPLSIFTGVVAWQRRPIGMLLSAALVVKGTAMAAAICAMLVSAWFVEGKLEVPPFVMFAAATVVSVWLGIRMYRREGSPGPRDARASPATAR